VKSTQNNLWLLLLLLVVYACQQPGSGEVSAPLFEQLSADNTGIFFENRLTHSNDFNIYKYRNYYNGGGVGLGDVNNDGLLDIYLTSNMEPNKLYLNKGNFQFEDVKIVAMDQPVLKENSCIVCGELLEKRA